MTRALIIVFAEPVDEDRAEEVLAALEAEPIPELVDAGIGFHVEHFTEQRAVELIAAGREWAGATVEEIR